MQYAVLGSTGLIVSPHPVAAMIFTAGNRRMSAVSKVDPDAAGELAAHALDAGE